MRLLIVTHKLVHSKVGAVWKQAMFVVHKFLASFIQNYVPSIILTPTQHNPFHNIVVLIFFAAKLCELALQCGLVSP